MQERGESSAQPQQQGWGSSTFDQQQTAQFPQARRWDANTPYNAPAAAYGQSAPPAATVKPRPRWKTPLIGAVTLVIGIVIGSSISGSKSDNPSTTAGTTSVSSNAPAAPTTAAKSAAAAAPAAPATSVVLQTSGSGQKTTKTFTVAADWSVKYTYDCASFGSTGNFAVMEHGGDLDGLPIINTIGAKGGDTTYQHNDGGQRSLEVNSECDWTLTVTSGDAG